MSFPFDLVTMLWIAGGLALGFALGYWRRGVKRRRRRDTLRFLLVHVPTAGMELCRQARTTYSDLYELEQEGLVKSESDGIAHPERGGHPRYFYSLTATGLAAATRLAP